MYAADNLSAYAVFGHRHMGEMLEQLEVEESQIIVYPAPAADSAGNSLHHVCDLPG